MRIALAVDERMREQDWLAERFETHRAHLQAVAYRLLGSPSEADDVVQEAWIRLSRADTSGVENLGGWLSTVVAQVCLDLLRSRRRSAARPAGHSRSRGRGDRTRQRPGGREPITADHRPLDASTKVLCGGPDAYLTDLLRYALSREGYAVRVAPSAGKALAIAERWRPHAAIVDGDPVDLGGPALCSQLRGCYGAAAILLTADAEEATRADNARGFGSRVAKPFRLRDLIDALGARLLPAVAGR